jgi:hypothetical protein
VISTYDHLLTALGAEERYFPWFPVEAALSIFKVSFLVKTFLEGNDENKGDYHQTRITSITKCLPPNDPFGSTVDHDKAHKPCRIHINVVIFLPILLAT